MGRVAELGPSACPTPLPHCRHPAREIQRKPIKLGNLGCQFRVGHFSWACFGPGNSRPLVGERENPMSVYPLELQRKIDRRWFHRSEETVSLRRHPKSLGDFSKGESAEDSNTRSPPTLASSAKPPPTLLVKTWFAHPFLRTLHPSPAVPFSLDR